MFSKFEFDEKQVFEVRQRGFRVGKRLLELNVDGKNSKFLYRHYFRIGTRPQNSRRCSDQAANFVHKFGSNFSKVHAGIAKIDVPNSFGVEGCYQTNKVTLQRTMIPESKLVIERSCSFDELTSRQKKAIQIVIKKLKIIKLKERSVKHL